MKIVWVKNITLIGRLLIGILFIVSGLTKLFALDRFIITVYQFKLIPEFIIPYFAFTLPIIEYLLGFSLLLGMFIRQAAQGLQFLVVTFILAIIINLIRGNIVECGCFGNFIVEHISISILLRDFLLLSLSIFISRQNEHIFALQNYIRIIH